MFAVQIVLVTTSGCIIFGNRSLGAAFLASYLVECVSYTHRVFVRQYHHKRLDQIYEDVLRTQTRVSYGPFELAACTIGTIAAIIYIS